MNRIKRAVCLFLVLAMLIGMAPRWELHVHAEENVAENTLEGKTISILGASISTYAGTSNGAAADTTNHTIRNNVAYYPLSTIPEVALEDTWWMQVCSDLGLRLLVNNSWSGSALFKTSGGTVGAYVDRCVQLHNDTTGEVPDIIAIQLGTNDFQYHKDTLGTANINYEALITENGDSTYTYAEPVTSLEAAAIVLHKISIRYPNAEVYYLNISQRVDGTDALIRSFNAELRQVVEHFGAHIVDIYGSAITMEDFSTYIGDNRVHPNCFGTDAYAEAFKKAVIANTGFSVEAHTVSLELDDVSADYGDDKLVVDGDAFTIKLTALAGDALDVTVTMDGVDITDSSYAGGTVTIDAVTADVTIAAKSVHVPQNYRWEFDGEDLVCVSGGNALTKNAGTTTDGVFNTTRYALEQAVVLSHDQPWEVEWRSEGTFKNTSGNGARVFTTDDVNAHYNARYLFKSNVDWLIAMGEKTTTGSHNYGVALADYGIDGSAPHIYRLENRIAEDGSNMVWLYVDGAEIGPLNHYYIGTTDQGTTSDWLSGQDFVFPYMGTDTHGFTNCSIDYIQVWEAGELPALEGFEYTLDEEAGTVTLTKYTGTESEVTVYGTYYVEGAAYDTVLDASSVFRGNATITAAAVLDGVAFLDGSMSCLFAECTNLVSVDLSQADTTGVTDMSYLFSCATSKASSLTTVDVTGLETGDVTTMRGMFSYCKKLSTLTGYESWNTGALESMYQMFNYVQALETIDLSEWDLDQVKNTGWCFQLCYAKQILLPENLGVISSGFLNHATQVQGSTFTIPAGVQKIGYGHTIYDFATNDFVEFRVAEGNTHYKAVDGILYSADGREMLAVPRGKIFENNTYEIPEGVTFLGELSFSRNYNIQTLVLPNSFVLEYVPVKDPAYVVYEDVGNLNAGTNLSIAIYCYTGITAYAVKEDNPNYTSRDGILYSKDMTQVVAVPARYDRLMDIPEGVTTWNMEAMWADYENNSNLDSLMANCPGVVIPASLTEIAGDQINRLNRLNRAYDAFTITVAEGNPVYCVDKNGDLVTHSPAESIVTPPTCTENGYTTHTCAICGDSYVDSYTDALGHSYQNSICVVCCEKESPVILPLGTDLAVTVTPANYAVISNSKEEKLACAPCFVTYGEGRFAVVYLADEVNKIETESSTSIVCRLALFDPENPEQAEFMDIAAAGQTIGDMTIGNNAPYEPNLIALEDGTLVALFNLRSTSGKYIYYGASIDPISGTVINYAPLTLDGREWTPANIATAYNTLSDSDIAVNAPTGSMVFTSKIIHHEGYYYGYCGGISEGFSGILVKSSDGINWTSVMAPEAAADMVGVIECGFGFIDEYVYFCMRDISSGIYHCSYHVSTGEQMVKTTKIAGLTTSKPDAFVQDGKLHVIVNKTTGDDNSVGRRNTAQIYEVEPQTCALTLVKQLFCADGIAYHSVRSDSNTNYWCFHTDARRIEPYTQGRSNLAFMEMPVLTTACDENGVLQRDRLGGIVKSGCITAAANQWQVGVVNLSYQLPMTCFTGYDAVTITANGEQKCYVAFFNAEMKQAGNVSYAEGWDNQVIMEPGETRTFQIPADAAYLYILNNNAAGNDLFPTQVKFYNTAHEHRYDSVVTEPTCTEDGYTTHTCAICGDSYVDSYTDALGHSYQNGICTVCGEVDPDYAVVMELRYDDHVDMTGKTVEIIEAGQPTSYQVGYGVEENTVLDTAVVSLVGDTLIATGIGTAKVRIDGQLYAVTVTVAPISLLLLIGQSNMEGNEGDPNQSIVCPDGMVYATYGDRYDMDITNATHYAPSALTGQYREINTVGGTDGLCDYPVYMLTDEGAGRKGPDSGFAYEWVKQTGEKVWIVNASHGGTSINVWQPGTTQYEECQAMFGACAETLRKEIAAGHFALSHMAYFWCQGCNDSTMTAENYVSKYLTMHESLKTELAFDHDSDGNTPQKTFEYGGIIPVRAGSNWSNGYRTGIYTDTTTGSNYESFKDLQMTGPRVAQYWMGNNPDLPDIWLVCNIGEKWVYMPDGTDGVADYFLAHYENGTVDYTTQVQQRESWYTPTTPAAVHDSIHYNQIGYNEVGRESVRTALINMGLLEAPEVETSVTFVTWDGYSTADQITASATASSGTLVVPMVYPLWEAKQVTYTLSDGLRWEWYDLLADSGETEGVLKAQGAAEGEVRVVKAEPGALYADHLSELPENLCCGVNLWAVLERDPYYYHSGVRWGIHESGTVYSVTIPIQPGDRIYATAFGKAGENGYASASGIRVTFFGEYGVVKTMEPTQTYTEFAANGGYIIAPEGATAVNIPMWTNDDSHEIYILNLPHDETTEICPICGKTSHIHNWSAWEVVTPPSADGPGTEQRTCACGETESRQVDGVWQTHDLGAHLQDLPERFCAGLNLWSVLEHDEEYYYSGLYWGTNAGVLVYSITIQVNPGDRIYATSFEAAGINGNSSAGIRVTFFDTYGIAKTLTPTQTHDEFTANGGYLVVPEGTIAVNIPVYGNCGNNQVYLLNAEHGYDSVITPPTCTEQGYTAHTCAICGDSYVDSYTDRRPLNILMIGNSFTWDAADCWYGLTESMTYATMKSMLAEGYDVHMGVMYKGSATLAYHATSAMNNTGGYAYTEIGPDTGYVWNPSSGGEEPNYILEYLNDRDWDIIVIQSYQHEADGTEPRSTYTGGDARFADPRDSLAYLLDYFAQHEPEAQVYYYMPWSTVKFYETDGTRAGFEAIAEYSETVIPHITGTNSGAALAGIIPVGTAIENARTTYLHDLRYSEIKTGTALQQDVQIGLLYDSQHLSFGIGRYIAGTVVAESLIPQQMRKDNITPPDIKDSPAVGSLPQEYSVIARLAAGNAVRYPYQVTEIPGYEVDLAERIADALRKADFAVDGVADENALLAHIEEVVAAYLLEAGDADVRITVNSFRLEDDRLMDLDATISIRAGYTTATAQISVLDGVTHCFGTWECVSEPTPEKPGSRCRTCSVCGLVQTEEVEGSWQKYDLAAHLQQLPEGVCCGTNLWDTLEPESVMIDHLGNWVSAGATVYSITIPIKPGDRIYANSFVEKGIQVSFIGIYGIIKTNFSSDTLREFNENGGYLIAPEGTIAVNIPVWNVNDENNTVNLLNYEHAYGAVTVKPTCTEQGYTTHTCDRCGDSYVDSYTDALDHSYGEWYETDAPSCTETGEERRDCVRCDHFETRRIPENGHSYVPVVTGPTCTEQGYTTHTCDRCGDSYVDSYTDALGHEYGDWYVMTEATLNTPGEERRDCIRCDHYESRMIPRLENPFVDVSEDQYYCEPVLWAVEQGITTGTGDGTTFSPDRACTRAQVVTFLWRAAGCPEPQSMNHNFTDVVAGSYYEKAVIWAVEQGITKGKGSATTFKPDLICSRAEVVTFLWRALDEPTPNSSENPFPDVLAGSYYEQAVLWAVENEITIGRGNGDFAPTEDCTRAHVVTFLYRAFAEE